MSTSPNLHEAAVDQLKRIAETYGVSIDLYYPADGKPSVNSLIQVQKQAIDGKTEIPKTIEYRLELQIADMLCYLESTAFLNLRYSDPEKAVRVLQSTVQTADAFKRMQAGY